MNGEISPTEKLYYKQRVDHALLEIKEQIAIAERSGALSTKRGCVERIREITDRLLLHLGGDL